MVSKSRLFLAIYHPPTRLFVPKIGWLTISWAVLVTWGSVLQSPSSLHLPDCKCILCMYIFFRTHTRHISWGNNGYPFWSFGSCHRFASELCNDIEKWISRKTKNPAQIECDSYTMKDQPKNFYATNYRIFSRSAATATWFDSFCKMRMPICIWSNKLPPA